LFITAEQVVLAEQFFGKSTVRLFEEFESYAGKLFEDFGE
jgi:hypothetical protein